MEVGKYPVEGNLMFAVVQEMDSEPWAQRRPEAHEFHADIQFLVSGEEKIGVLRSPGKLEVTENRMESDDVAFYKITGEESALILKPGMFAVFFPADIHRPCCHVTGTAGLRRLS
jgi:biofilm protein TabA